jgi:hypothetical protein
MESIDRVRRAAIFAVGASLLAGSVLAAPDAAPGQSAAPKILRLAISPSGAHVGFITDVKGELTFVVRGTGGATELVKPLGKTQAAGVSWVGDDHVLVFTTRTEANLAEIQLTDEFASSYVEVVYLKTRKSLILRRDLQGFAGAFDAGGRSRAYFYEAFDAPSGATKTYLSGSLTQVDLDSGANRIATFAHKKTRSKWLTSPQDGAVLAEQEYDPQSKRWAVYAGHAHQVLLCEIMATAEHAAKLEGEGRRKGTVLVRETLADADRWFEIDIQTAAKVELFAGEAVTAPIFDRTTGLLIGVESPTGPGLRMFDPSLQSKVERALAASGRGAVFTTASAGFDTVVVWTPDGAWRVVDAATGASWSLNPAPI